MMPASDNLGPVSRYVAALAVSAFAMNWIWEMVQMPAYAEVAGRTWGETAATCALASLGDVSVTLAIFGIGTLAAGRLLWAIEGGWNVYLSAALLGAGCAIAYEWRAIGWRWWTYTDQMPVVPILEVGLWPLLQLTLLVPLAFWIARWWSVRG